MVSGSGHTSRSLPAAARLTHIPEGSPLSARSLLVCADDFGLHPAIDSAVLELAGRARLSGTGCLVDGPSFAMNAAALRQSGLQAGLHLNFTEALGREGLYLPLGQLIRACWARRLDPIAVRGQIAAQLARYEDVMGRVPDYVDGHQHVHQFPQIRDALHAELAARYPAGGPRPWLRCTVAASMRGMPPMARFKAGVIALLGARSQCRHARRMGFEMNRGLLGVYDFRGGAAVYAALLRAWLGAVQPGDLIMCHPSAQAVPDDALGDQRRAEFEVWSSDEVGEWLQRFNLQIHRGVSCRPGPAHAA